MMNRISLVVLAIFLFGCKSNAPRIDTVISGETMGTYYAITLPEGSGIVKSDIEELLEAFNDQVSTYIPTSTISKFNASTTEFEYFEGQAPYFDTILRTSLEIQELTNGYFDPSVMPLVNYWGFGYKGRSENFEPDSLMVEEILRIVGLTNLIIEKSEGVVKLIKPDPAFQLDFSAIAKGYGVDVLSAYLDSSGVSDYLIDIGGEGYCKGLNKNEELWSFGISTPDENAPMNDLTAILTFSNMAIATSGNYRNFYLSGDRKFVHTVNPKTGYTEASDILSVTVIADNCMMADALATSMMAMGSRAALTLAEAKQIDALLITGDKNGGYVRLKAGDIAKHLK